MKSFPLPILLLLVCACLSACVSTEEMKKRQAARVEAGKISGLESASTAAHEAFRKTKTWKKTVFHDSDALALATGENLKIKVVIDEQRGFLFVKNLIGYDFPLATGRKSHPTPTGDFKIIAKERNHHSNKYGKIVDAEGNVTVANAESGKHQPGEGESFQGASMPYFMRLTNDGVGLHIGYIPGYAASHGCIRIPTNVAPYIYKTAPIGTPVTIVQTNDTAKPATKTSTQPAAKPPVKPLAKTAPPSRNIAKP